MCRTFFVHVGELPNAVPVAGVTKGQKTGAKKGPLLLQRNEDLVHFHAREVERTGMGGNTDGGIRNELKSSEFLYQEGLLEIQPR
jgi:hypothetical protein